MRKTIANKYYPLFISCILFISFLDVAYGQKHQQSPAAAAYKHASNLTPDNYHPEIAAQTLYGADPAEAPKLADQLKKVMDAYGIHADTNKISTDPNFVDTLSKKNIHYPFPEYKDIYLQKIGNSWYYSSYTVQQIPNMYLKVFPKGSATIALYLKKLGSGVFLGLEQWQWWGFLIIILGAIIVYFLSFFLSRLFVNILIKRRIVHTEDSKKIIHSSAKLFSLIMAIRLVRQLYPLLLLPLSFNATILMITGIVQIIFLGFLLYRITDIASLIAAKIAARTTSTLDDQLVPLARKIVKALLIISTFFLVLSQTGVNLTALLAGISIGGLALAFAAQDTVKNIFGSMMLLFDRSFQIGDQVIIPSIDGIEGVVEEVGLRSTRIRTFDNSLISVPNGKLADAAINNLGLRILRRYKFNLGINYDTPPELTEQFIYGVRQLMEINPLVKQDTIQAHVYSFDVSSLVIRCSCYFDTQDFNEELNARQQLNLDIIKLAGIIGVQFAYPTSTMHIENAPWQTTEGTKPPKYKPHTENIEKINRFADDLKNSRKIHPGDNAD